MILRRSIFISILGSLLVVASVKASSPRTFVAGDGVDTNPCTLTMPCRSFQVAVNATSSGGEVVALSSAGYGPLNVLSSVSIIAPTGVYAGIFVSSGDGIFVGNSSVNLVLRGLTLNGNGGGGRGVYIFGGVLHVEDCVFTGFGTAIDASPTQTFIKDTILRGNDTGIAIGAGKASIDHVRAENNRIGIRTDADSATTVRDSVAAGNTSDGFFAFIDHGTTTVLILENCMAANNDTGIAEGGSTVVVSNCCVTGNTTYGITGNGGLVYSRQNNTVFNNGTNVSATITPLPPV